VLIELFDKIENFFIRLQTYAEAPPTAAMANVMGKIMAEVLCILSIATKEMRQKRTSRSIYETMPPLTQTLLEKFLKKLIGRNDIEDALQRLDKLEQGELRAVTAQVLKTTGDLKDVACSLKDATSDIKDATGDLKDGA
jgi:hypothetical protein